ncbi:MAG: DsbA family protein [Fimbriimonadaceae bacterium]
MIIPVAHDFNCPWCWVALFQTKQLKAEFGVEFEWRAYELMPEALPWDESAPRPEAKTDRPKTPTRMDLAYAAQGIPKPTAERAKRMRTHNCHEAVEFAKLEGVHEPLIEAIYRGYWEQSLNVNEIDTLIELAKACVSDLAGLRLAIETKQFNDKIVPYDDEAYASGVYNVPTYWIGGERYAEQPISVLREAIARELSGQPR